MENAVGQSEGGHVLETELRQIKAKDTLALRQRVLWPDRPVSHVQVQGDETALHLGAFDGDKMIGCGSFFPQGDGAQLRKLAILEGSQGRGVGSALLLKGAREIKATGLQILWCDARETAIGFYERLGFVISPERFVKSGLVYVKAELVL